MPMKRYRLLAMTLGVSLARGSYILYQNGSLGARHPWSRIPNPLRVRMDL